MNLNTAIQFGLLVKAAEKVPPADLTNAAGQMINTSVGGVNTAYQVITTIYANDLATDMNPGRGNQIVSFGLILQTSNDDVVIAVRGTEGVWEWVHDAEFATVQCPFLVGAGNTEDGFTAIYNSLRIDTAPASSRVTDAMATLPFKRPINSLTVCGHSLGGAIATLLGLDLAANTSFKNPTVYTYASPRTGDSLFVSTYNQVVPHTFRIANRIDIVPKLPLAPPYDHVSGLFDVNPVKFAPLPKELVKFDILCEHHLTSYLYLLSLLAGGDVQPLNPECAP